MEVSMEGRFIKVLMETTEAVEVCAVIEQQYGWPGELENGLRARLKGVLEQVTGLYVPTRVTQAVQKVTRRRA